MTVSTLCCQGDSEDVQKQWLPRVQYFGYETFAELRYVHTPCFVSHSPSPTSHSSLFSTLPHLGLPFTLLPPTPPPIYPSSAPSYISPLPFPSSTSSSSPSPSSYLPSSYLPHPSFSNSLFSYLSPIPSTPISPTQRSVPLPPLHHSFLLLPPHPLPPCLSIG